MEADALTSELPGKMALDIGDFKRRLFQATAWKNTEGAGVRV